MYSSSITSDTLDNIMMQHEKILFYYLIYIFISLKQNEHILCMHFILEQIYVLPQNYIN